MISQENIRVETSVGPVSVHTVVACLDEGVKQENSRKQQTNKLNLYDTLQKSTSDTFGQTFFA